MSGASAEDYKKLLINPNSAFKGKDRSQEVILFHAILPSVTLLLLLARNYSRFCFIKVQGWDDVLLNVAWVFTAGMGALICYLTKFGIGRHITQVPVEDRMELLKFIWISQSLYLFANCLIKNAFFVFYLRIAYQGIYQHLSKALIVVNTCIFVSCLFSALFICQPAAFFWNRTLEGGTCGNIKVFYLANASLNMLMDVATLALPIPMIWGSATLTLKQKVKISALFLLGGITCFASVMRIPTLLAVTKIGGDVTFHMRSSSDWTASELNCALLAACIPAIKPLFSSLFGKGKTTDDHSHSKKTKSSNPSSGLGSDNRTIRDHLGDVRASITVPRIGGRGHGSRPYSLSGKGDKGRLGLGKGEHILLEDTYPVDTREDLELGCTRETSEDGRWESSHSIVLSDVERARGRQENSEC